MQTLLSMFTIILAASLFGAHPILGLEPLTESCWKIGCGANPYRSRFLKAFKNESFLSDQFKSEILDTTHSYTIKFDNDIHYIEFSPDGTKLAAISSGAKTHIIDILTEEITTWDSHRNFNIPSYMMNDSIKSFSFSPDSALCAIDTRHSRSDHVQGKIDIIDITTNKVIFSTPYEGRPLAPVFSSDSKKCAVITNAKNIIVDIMSQTPHIITPSCHGGEASFSNRNTLLTIRSERTTNIIDVNSATTIHTFNVQPSLYQRPPRYGSRNKSLEINKNYITHNPDGTLMVSACQEKKLCIFNLKIFQNIHKLLVLPESFSQLRLLQACDKAMTEKQYVHVTEQQEKTFHSFPERMQNALRKYIITKEQYRQIKRKRNRT